MHGSWAREKFRDRWTYCCGLVRLVERPLGVQPEFTAVEHILASREHMSLLILTVLLTLILPFFPPSLPSLHPSFSVSSTWPSCLLPLPVPLFLPSSLPPPPPFDDPPSIPAVGSVIAAHVHKASEPQNASQTEPFQQLGRVRPSPSYYVHRMSETDLGKVRAHSLEHPPPF